MDSSDCFFPATAMAGRLHLRDIGDRALWDPTRIGHSEEQYVDIVLGRLHAHKVRTVEELDETLEDSRDKAGSIDLYLHESLRNEAHHRWEKMQKALPPR